jgi:hypothetical protein
MKKLVTLCAISIVCAALISCTSQECQLHEGIQDAKFEVEEIENGIVIKVTSDNPERVAEIQKHCKQVVVPQKAGILPCGKCPGSKKCWDKKATKTEL